MPNELIQDIVQEASPYKRVLSQTINHSFQPPVADISPRNPNPDSRTSAISDSRSTNFDSLRRSTSPPEEVYVVPRPISPCRVKVPLGSDSGLLAIRVKLTAELFAANGKNLKLGLPNGPKYELQLHLINYKNYQNLTEEQKMGLVIKSTEERESAWVWFRVGVREMEGLRNVLRVGDQVGIRVDEEAVRGEVEGWIELYAF